MPTKNEEIGVFIVVTTGLILLLIGFIILILFLYKRKQFNFHKRFEIQQNEHDKSLLSAQLEIQEQTLQYISREIHDNIGHSLSLVKLALNTIEWEEIPGIAHKVDGAMEQLVKAMTDISYLSKTMSYDYIADHGLVAALQLEVEQIKRLNLYAIRLELSGTQKSIGPEKEVVIFRIVQEALNNSIKHASPTELIIRVQYTDSQLGIQVIDNGKGWGGNAGSKVVLNGSGLKNMRQRTRQLNGAFSIKNNQPAGTTVGITIPIEEKD